MGVSLSNLTLCYEGIQRTYRNAVVARIRSGLLAAYGVDASRELRKPFQKEWDEIRASAEERRKSGELGNAIRDEFDLLGVNHFFNIFDVHYDALDKNATSETPKQRQVNKQALLHWMKAIKDLRDPLSHPSEDDFPYEDAFLLLDLARRVLERLGNDDEAAQLRSMYGRLHGKPLEFVNDPIEDRIPPRDAIVIDFVGRTAELRELWRWLEDPQSRRWALAGEGGKGKSALAYQFATEVKFRAPAPFELVLWLSAKRKRFDEGAVVPVPRPDFEDLESATDYILASYGWSGEVSQPLADKRMRALQLLESFPALVIVDDVDSLEQTAEDATEFFTLAVPTTRTNVLLTSRRVLFGLGASTTHIAGLCKDDAEQFITRRVQRMELDPAVFTDEARAAMIKLTESSPLYLEELLRFCSAVGLKEAMKQWAGKGGHEARQYALKREIDLLTESGKAALVAACIDSRPATLAQLEALTGMGREELASALGELHRLFLVAKPRLLEGEERYECNVNTRLLVLAMMEGSETYRNVRAAHRAISGDLPRTGRSEIRDLIRQSVFLVRAGQVMEAEALLVKALEKHVNDPDLTAFLAWVYKASKPRRVSDARRLFVRAAQLHAENAEMYIHWARMEIEEHQWLKAAEAAEKGLRRLPNTHQLMFHSGYARSRLAKELFAGHLEGRAVEETMKSLTVLLKGLKDPADLRPGERVTNASMYRAIVMNYEMLGRGEKVREYLAVWRSEHPDDATVDLEWQRLARKFRFGEGTKELTES